MGRWSTSLPRHLLLVLALLAVVIRNYDRVAALLRADGQRQLLLDPRLASSAKGTMPTWHYQRAEQPPKAGKEPRWAPLDSPLRWNIKMTHGNLSAVLNGQGQLPRDPRHASSDKGTMPPGHYQRAEQPPRAAKEPRWERLDSPLLRRNTPVTHGNLSAVLNGPGSVFGRMYHRLVCPAADTARAVEGVGPPYAPRVLFPLSAVEEAGRSAVGAGGQGEQLTLLVGVLSSCGAVEARNAARSTWQRLAVPPGTSWRSVFIMSSDCEQQLAQEHRQHGDLVFYSVKEGYYALTDKVRRRAQMCVAVQPSPPFPRGGTVPSSLTQLPLLPADAQVLQFFHFARDVGARFTLKTDDDTFVYVDRLLGELQVDA